MESANNRRESQQAGGNRRLFLKTSSAATLSGALGIAPIAHASESEPFRIALVGCGGRGTSAAVQTLNANPQAKLVVMADAFENRLNSSLRILQRQKIRDRVEVPKERQFVGLDAYQQALAADVDMVLLCTPPGFRPAQFEAAVEAGKHVFMEKPVATDAPGVRRVFAANKRAKEKRLVVAVGHHLRHEDKHRQLIQRIHDGAIGEVQYLRAYFNSRGVWVKTRKPGQSEMEYQVNNWYYFTWLSGDHIVEQHIHDLDVCNWIMQGHPVEAQGMGGRQVRKGSLYGEIFDHHAVEFTYANGVKLFSFCRHIPDCWNSFSQHVVGSKGSADLIGHGDTVLQVKGQEPVTWKRNHDGHQIEHDDLFAAMRAGKPYNECDVATASTMTAILGRMASYSGKVVTWDEGLNSQVDLAPERLAWDALPRSLPDDEGQYACAMPGKTNVL